MHIRRGYALAAWTTVLMATALGGLAPAAAEAGRAAMQEAGARDEQGATLVEELGRALGMTPAEVEALGLSPAEMQNLLAGFTEETVVVGSRAQPRSATESAVPVDVLTVADLGRQGGGDLKDQLRNVIPSFNVNTQPIGGASTVVRPAMLRNLAPDHTLILVNGKRRHRASIIDWHGGNGVAYGSQAPDISTIPSIALRQVEVLRDGAAAQYGSDAIAGVMNFQLKDAASGGSLQLDTGMFGAGDGESYRLAGNVGLPLGPGGFANLSLQYGASNPTNRAAPRRDAVALIAAGNTHVVSEAPQLWGAPEVDDDLALFGNFGYTQPAGVELYAHTNYASKTVTGGFFLPQPERAARRLQQRQRPHAADRRCAGGARRRVGRLPDGEGHRRPARSGRAAARARRSRLLLGAGDIPGRLHAADGRSGDRHGDRRGCARRRRRPRLGRERRARRPPRRPVHRQHRERLSRPRLADLVRHRHRPAARDQPPGRRLVRGHGPGQPRCRRRMARRAVRHPQRRSGHLGRRSLQRAGLLRGRSRLPGPRVVAGRRLESRQLRRLRRPGDDRRRRRLDGRRGDPGGALRGLRRDDERQGVRPPGLRARQREHRVSGAYAGPAERVQPVELVRPHRRLSDHQGDHSAELAGGATARRGAARAGGIDQPTPAASCSTAARSPSRPTTSASRCPTASASRASSR